MARTADIRNGIVMEQDGKLLQVVYFQHVKPGKGSAFVRTKLRNVRTGLVVERTFPSGERFTEVDRLGVRVGNGAAVDGAFQRLGGLLADPAAGDVALKLGHEKSP